MSARAAGAVPRGAQALARRGLCVRRRQPPALLQRRGAAQAARAPRTAGAAATVRAAGSAGTEPSVDPPAFGGTLAGAFAVLQSQVAVERADGGGSPSGRDVAKALRTDPELRRAVGEACEAAYFKASGATLADPVRVCDDVAEFFEGHGTQPVSYEVFERELRRHMPGAGLIWPLLRSEEGRDAPTATQCTGHLDRVPHQHLVYPHEYEPLLPPPDREYPLHVVLDVDETLLHSFFPNRNIRYGSLINGTTPRITSRSHRFELHDTFYVTLRPGATDLIRWLHAQGCEVIVWTAGTEMYAGTIADELLPIECVHHWIYRDDRWFDETTTSTAIKYLSHLARPLSRTVIVENNPYVCAANINNAILVKDFFDAEEDPSLETVQLVISDLIEAVRTGRRVDEVIPSHPALLRKALPRRNSTEDPDHFTRTYPPSFWAVPPPPKTVSATA